LEDNAIAGGAGAGVNEFLAAQSSTVDVLNLGIEDSFVEHGSLDEQRDWAGLNSAEIESKICSRLKLLAQRYPVQIDASTATPLK
jgi:1-deoxy-D-xylulose-5-phosphate synthase